MTSEAADMATPHPTAARGMQRARELLLDGLPVGSVAADVGYEHHSSFAQAFRSYFGFPPMELRRRRPPR